MVIRNNSDPAGYCPESGPNYRYPPKQSDSSILNRRISPVSGCYPLKEKLLPLVLFSVFLLSGLLISSSPVKAATLPDTPWVQLAMAGEEVVNPPCDGVVNSWSPPAIEPTFDPSVYESEISVSPTSHDFGQVIGGETSSLEVTIDNNGAVALTVLGISSSNSTNFNCTGVPQTIPANSNYTFSVIFAPQSDGTLEANLTIISNDYDNPSIQIALSGTGVFPPLSPTNLTATATGCQIDLSWTDNSDNEDGFRLERKESGQTWDSAIQSTVIDTTTYQDTNGLVAGATYDYRVYAYNIAGDSLASNEPSATISSSVPVYTYYRDADEDTYGDPNNSTQACSAPPEYVSDNTDCDDSNGEINPTTVWYLDGDGDYYSDGTTDGPACERPTNYYLASELTGAGGATSGDCNDADAAVNPGATELCDGIDSDCDNGGVLPTDIVLESQTIVSGETVLYEASNSISISEGTNFTIQNGADVTFCVGY